MKLKVSLKDKEASLDADIEKLIEKKMETDDKRPNKKTRYQIKQEEKRKTELLKQKQKRINEKAEHKRKMQSIYLSLGIAAVCLIICFAMMAIGYE